MSAGLVRATQFAIKEEVTTGTLIAPSAGSDFIPLKAGFELTPEFETVDSEELVNDIGVAKSYRKKESVSGKHDANLKNSGVVATEPDCGLLYEATFGGVSIASTEYNTVASSTVNVVKVDTAEGLTFEEGEALLVKHSSNNWEVRNISSITSDDLTVSFSLANAPGTGINLGRAILYKPGTSYPSFSAWLYNGNGYAVQAAAGCTVSELSFDFKAMEFGTVSFGYEGLTYYFNPIEITSSTKFIDWTDSDGTWAAQVDIGWYRDPIELATAIQNAMNEASTEDFVVTYSSLTGKFTIATVASLTFSILWNTGTNTANSIATKVGFTTAANSTAALTYTSPNAMTLTHAFTPSYDDVDPIILKSAELMIGSQTENLNLCASAASIKISKELTDVECFRSETGIDEKIATKREVTMEVTLNLQKYEVNLFDYLLNMTSIQASLTCGPKVGGNWIAGKTANFYFRNATVTERSITGDNIIEAKIMLKGFVSGTTKDFYLNFI